LKKTRPSIPKRLRLLGPLASLLPIALIVVAFALLYFLPSLFQKREFTLEGTPDKRAAQLPQFPLETKMTVIQAGKSGRTVGTKISLRDLLKESPVIVNFWATWCPPCIDEFPSLEVFGSQLSSSPQKTLPRLVTISVDDAASDVARMYKTLEFAPTMLVLHDPEGAVARQVGTTKFPETYLIGKDGATIHKWVGPQNWLAADVLRRLAQFK
jgi:thiol-disulfide isomerase/thioredoxin